MNLVAAVKGMFGAVDPEAPLEDRTQKFMAEKWNELKNAYTVYHAAIWEAFLFYAGQMWIAWDENRKIWQPAQAADDWVPRPKINRYSPAVDAIASNFSTVPEVEAVARPADDQRLIGVAQVANALAQHVIKDNALRADYKSDEDKAGLAAQLLALAGCVFTEVRVEEEQTGTRPKVAPVTKYGYQCVGCDIHEGDLPEPVTACPA